jgi:hypothetical protein
MTSSMAITLALFLKSYQEEWDMLVQDVQVVQEFLTDKSPHFYHSFS